MSNRMSPAVERAVAAAAAAAEAGKPMTAAQLRERIGLSGVQMQNVREALDHRGIPLTPARARFTAAERETWIALQAQGFGATEIARAGGWRVATVQSFLQRHRQAAAEVGGPAIVIPPPPPPVEELPPVSCRIVASLMARGLGRVAAEEQARAYRDRHARNMRA